jgi:hypothetical protein
VDPEIASPPADPHWVGATTDAELDAIGADLAAIETALDELAAGTYRHDDTDVDPGPPAP